MQNEERKNVLVSLLKLLNVKHTTKFSNKYFNEHPHKYNLFGISKMLLDYGIKSVGTQIKNKEEDIYHIETPFIAHTGSDFVIVTKTGVNEIDYIWNGKMISLLPKQFLNIWTGFILLVQPKNSSIEPNYSINRKTELFGFISKILFVFLMLMLCIVNYFSHNSLYNIGLVISVFINIAGTYIGYLLILNQIHIHSNYFDKICSLFKHNDCNNIQESKAAKFWGLITWGEIGFSYFISNLLLLVFFPGLVFYMALVNIITLPYTFWSIWYQKVKAKQWCPLCVIVQFLLWLILINNIMFNVFQMPVWTLENLVWTICIYTIPILVINLCIYKISEGNKAEILNYEINSIKSNIEVFNALLKSQPMYPVNKSNSQIIFGNPAGIMITILTNPHCNPCSKMHVKAEKLLHDSPDIFCIQYVFSSFNENYNKSNKILIAAYLNNSKKEAKKLYDEWFVSGRLDRESFYMKYNYDIEDENVVEEFDSHEQWINETKLHVTPTILVNGYKLPDNYKIEDLKYFSELKIDVN